MPAGDAVYDITARLPEKFNIHLTLAKGHVELLGKVEGVIEVATKVGDVYAAKLRCV